MKTTAVTAADFARSVMAVPPLALDSAWNVAPAANRQLIDHIAAGGVTTLLYAGNANVYHLTAAAYTAMAELIAAAAPADTWVVPGIGPDFGKMLNQVAVLRRLNFPTALCLPMAQAIHPQGVETGLRHVADHFGRPLMVYLRVENYLKPEQLGRLVQDGVVCGIKYAIERPDPLVDSFLDNLLKVVDRGIIVSGMGERPAVAHTATRGLAGFTSGLVCIAPKVSQAILRAVQSGDPAKAKTLAQHFKPLEDLRERFGFIRVLHDLIRLAGVADTGPVMPMLAPLDPDELATVQPALAAFLSATR